MCATRPPPATCAIPHPSPLACRSYLSMAQKEGNQEVTGHIETALKAAMEAKQATLRPEIQLLNRLLGAEDAAARQRVRPPCCLTAAAPRPALAARRPGAWNRPAARRCACGRPPTRGCPSLSLAPPLAAAVWARGGRHATHE